MTVKIFCKLADCVNWDNGLCGAEEIRIDREGYCATYEEIPEEETDEVDVSGRNEQVNWQEEEDQDLEIDELGEDEWEELDEEDGDDDAQTDGWSSSELGPRGRR